MNNSVQTLRDFSLSYQHSYISEGVVRLNLLDDLQDLAINEGKCLIVEGIEGIGKTQLMLQFAERHAFDSFIYLVNPACQFTYKLDYLLEDLGRQVYFYNNSAAPSPDLEFNEGNFAKLIFDLMRAPGRKNKPVYFLLDALDQMGKSDLELIRPILNQLPWNTNNFYFIVTGEKDKLKDIIPEAAFRKSQYMRVVRFSFDESLRLFAKCGANKDQVKEVHDTWNGHPERLSQIKRIIESGTDFESFLIRDDIKQKNDLLDTEWEQVGLDESDFSDDVIKLLCVLAFDENTRNINKIIRILGNENQEFISHIRDISFLNFKGEDVSFVSNSFHSYLVKKLKKHDSLIINLLIKYYDQQENLESILNLSSLYAKKLEWNSVIKLLTIDNLGVIISNSKSFADIKKQINNGFLASQRLGNSHNNLLRFSLYRSTLNAFQRSDTREAQLSAYAALGKGDSAISLISSAALREDRLRMFINYAKELNIRKRVVEPLVIQEIKDLLAVIDIDYIKENTVDMVLGLAYILPEEAVKLVERLSGMTSEKGSLEWLLSYVAMIVAKENALATSSIKVSGKDYTSNDFVEKFAKSIGYGISDVHEESIISVIERIEIISDRLYMLRRWIQANPRAENIDKIIEFAFDLLVKDSIKIKPTTTTLLDIAFPLVEIDNKDSVDLIVSRLDGLLVSITSPTDDKIRLQTLIIESLFKFDTVVASKRAYDLYMYIDKMDDHSIKLTSLCHIMALVHNLENSNLKYDLSDFKIDEAFVKLHIEIVIDQLLALVAEQYVEVSDALDTLAKHDFVFSLKIANKLNTLERRSNAMLKALSVYLEAPLSQWDTTIIKQLCIDRLSDDFYGKAVLSVFEAAIDKKEVDVSDRDKILNLTKLIEKISENDLKSYCLTKSIFILSQKPPKDSRVIPNYKKVVTKLSEHLSKFYNKIDTSWHRTEIGYRITSDLAESNPEIAEEYFNSAEGLSNDNIINNTFHAAVAVDSIRLVIRTYCALFKYEKEYSYSKIGALIIQIPSIITQISLWAELASRLSLTGIKNVTDDIVTKRILPQIEKYKSNKDYVYFSQLLKVSAAAIHSVHPATLKLHMNELSTADRETIVSSVCYTILTGCSEADPFDGNNGNPDFNHNDATQYIEMLGFVENDNLLYYHISNLCSISKKTIDKFTRVQKSDIVTLLQALIKQKLPKPNTGVNHEGFAIVAEAAIEQFSVQSSYAAQSVIDALDPRVSNVPNVADRSYIYSLLSSESSVKKKKIEFINKAFEEADKITSVREKIQRYETALDTVYAVAPETFKQRLNQIHGDIYKLDEAEMFPTYRKLIDLTYKYDKGLAQKLITDLDNDPARIQMTEPANKHLVKLEAESSTLKDYSKVNSIRNNRETAKVIWKMLGQLNAGTRHSRDIAQTSSILNKASRASLFYSMPLYEFFIQNASRELSSDRSLFTSFFETTASNASFCLSLILSISNKKNKDIALSSTYTDNTFIVKQGSRDEAIEYIAKHVRSSDSKEIYLIDPYFSEKDIDTIKNISGWCHGSTISVLTSYEAGGEFGKSSFNNAWRKISAEEFPAGQYVSVSNQFKKSPFHDRWLLLHDQMQGLKIGTSFNQLGENKVSEISVMFSEDVKDVYNTIIRPLLKRESNDFGDQQIKFEMFDI